MAYVSIDEVGLLVVVNAFDGRHMVVQPRLW